jgi:5-formyltetrahydrofolate cyclo-ligase
MASAESVSLEDQKRALRREMNARRTRVEATERARAARAAADRLLDLPALGAAQARGACVAGFVATRGELDPAAALGAARGRGARVALPRIADAERPRLRFHLATSSAADELPPGRFGIPEPAATAPEVAADEIAVMLVPGLAFDRTGRRLGFGGGYYDEWLGNPASPRPACVIGVGYDFQVVDACPAGARDVQVDYVVTEARVIRCAPAGTTSPEGFP